MFFFLFIVRHYRFEPPLKVEGTKVESGSQIYEIGVGVCVVQAVMLDVKELAATVMSMFIATLEDGSE